MSLRSENNIIVLRMRRKKWNVLFINILMNFQVTLKAGKFID